MNYGSIRCPSVAEFPHQPSKCSQSFRMIVVRRKGFDGVALRVRQYRLARRHLLPPFGLCAPDAFAGLVIGLLRNMKDRLPYLGSRPQHLVGNSQLVNQRPGR